MDESLDSGMGGTINNHKSQFTVGSQHLQSYHPKSDSLVQENRSGMRHPFSSSELFNAFNDPNKKENRTMGIYEHPH